MGFHVDYDLLNRFSFELRADSGKMLEALGNVQKGKEEVGSSCNMAGMGAENIRAYLNCVHGFILYSLSNLLKAHADNCLIYVTDYADRVDHSAHAIVDDGELTEISQRLLWEKNQASTVCEKTNVALSQIADLTSLTHVSFQNAENAFQETIQLISRLKKNVVALENEHSSGDFSETHSLISSLRSFIQTYLGENRSSLQSFSVEKMIRSQEYLQLVMSSLAVETQISNNTGKMKHAAKLAEERIEILQKEAEDRKKEAEARKMIVTGLCVIGSAAVIVLSGGAATPLVVGAVSGVSGAIIAGHNSAMDQYAETGSVDDWGSVVGDAAIGGVSGFISGYVGAAVGGAITDIGKSTGNVLLTSRNQAVRIGAHGVIGATSDVISGVASRGATTFTENMILSGGDVDQSWIEAKKDALDGHQIAKDAVLGGISGGIEGGKNPRKFPDRPDGTYEPQKKFTENHVSYRTDDNGKVHMFYDKKSKVWKKFPNEEYVSNGYYYQTDEYGDIICANGKLKLSSEERQSLNIKLEYMKKKDQRGHLFADIFGGSNQSDNVFPQNAALNDGEFKKMELQFAETLQNNGTVYVDYKLQYDGLNSRPTGIQVRYTTNTSDGISHSGIKVFKNK